MTDKLRKYVLPNIPYVFIGWVFLKLGTAYRLAVGGDFAHKLLGLGQTVGAAFADFAPGLAPFDWLVGIVGAVAFRLLIYFKSKNAKKFRRDAEYGSARWGNEKDIKPFVDPKFENNMLLTATERLTMNTRPKNPANARNLNFCGIGSSGSGKTRFWLTPQLLQAHSSYVVVDPKGGVLGQVGSFLQKRGYKIKVFNSIDFSKSMHYNPLAYIKTEADILKFVNALISNTKGEGKEGDPFWTKAETLLYCALLGYIIFEGAEEDRNMNTLVDMISGMEVKEDDEDFLNAVDYMFKGLEQRKPKGWIIELSEKRKELLAEKAAEEAVFLPNLLMKYMEVRKAERSDWTRAGQNRGTSKDLKAVSEALSYLQRKGLSTVEDLENFIETSGKSAADYRKQMKPKETRSNVIDAILAARTDCKECKPVYEKYQKIFFKKTKEKFKLEHPEVARFEKASAYLAKHPDDKDSTKKELLQEQAKLVGEIADLKVPLTEVQEDLKKLRDIRYWVRKATPGTEESKEPPKKQPLKEVLQDKADEKKAQKNAPAQTKHKQQDMEL